MKCPFCKDPIDKGMTLYDHWCDMGEADEACQMLSDMLETRREKKK